MFFTAHMLTRLVSNSNLMLRGFEPQIRAILNDLPAEKQLLMFTATWPKSVQNLAATFLKDPVHVRIGDNELHANKAITQNIIVLRNSRGSVKHEALLNLLKEINPSENKTPNKIPKCIIFVSRKDDCDFFRDMLHDEGYAVDALHGDKSQNYRDIAMANFRRGSIRVLLATDVAARGLDIKDIEVVVNYEFPNAGVEDYVHRIGRTARGDRTGVSYTFFGEADRKHAADLVALLKKSEQEVPRELQDMVPRNRSEPSQGRYFGQRSYSGPRDRYGAAMGQQKQRGGGFRGGNEGFRGGRFESRGPRGDDFRSFSRRGENSRGDQFGRRRFAAEEEERGREDEVRTPRSRSYSAPSAWESERRGSWRRYRGAEEDAQSEGRSRFPRGGRDGGAEAGDERQQQQQQLPQAVQPLGDDDISPLLRRRREISSKLRDT
jgi:ATP-dependent RNA helicase DDX5/DBP2